MKQKWLEYSARFGALARRERAMVAAAIFLGGGILGYSLLIEPQFIRKATQAKRLAQANADLATIDTQLVTMQTTLQDSDADNRAALLRGQKEQAAFDTKLRAIEASMVPPDKMKGFLESLLSKHRNLELLTLRTLTPTSLIERSETKKAEGKTGAAPAAALSAAPNIYKHGVEIRIAGSYDDLLMYLAEIERLPQRIIWNRDKFSAEQYPRNEMTLTLYTLSLDKQWLVV